MDQTGNLAWMEALPAGWVSGRDFAKRLFEILRTGCRDADPAPWHAVEEPEYWAPLFRKNVADYVLNQKLGARLEAAFQRGICSGLLAPCWFDGTAFKSIPQCCFGRKRIVRGALLDGWVEVDPFWPDEWQAWSSHSWAIPTAQLKSWKQTGDHLSIEGLPLSDSELPPCDILPITERRPSEASRVPLSEAVTWLAFGVALNAERLGRAISWERLANGDLQAAQQQMETAAETLLQAGANGSVAIFGRHVESHEERGARTEKVDQLALDDYRKAWVIGQDSLHFGSGLMHWYRAPNDSQLRTSDRRDHFANVTVERKALMKLGGRQARLSGHVPPNRQLDHADIRAQAASMRASQPGISKGSAAASIVADLAPNPRTGRPRDTRHIERLIADLWEGGASESPP